MSGVAFSGLLHEAAEGPEHPGAKLLGFPECDKLLGTKAVHSLVNPLIKGEPNGPIFR